VTRRIGELQRYDYNGVSHWILNPITGISEVYVRCVEILTAGYRVVGMTSSGGISGPNVPKMALPTFILVAF
jgi:hypothetical protein